ncbi:thioesterase family protein [Cobetia sp. QF-1]|uniref:thioesterase family protein n=1 Tax=Cobetia sp. QF-1 TaxID=1969833 RepID=UPI000B539E36|nr:thioesterase family protein [Cobetia sp. QF-1]
MALLDITVPHAWVDYNGHMNDAEYARAFSMAVEALMEHVGLDAEGRREHDLTIYTLETHLCYLAEAHEGQPLKVDVLLLDHDPKRQHVLFTLTDADGGEIATSEQMLMAMSISGGRPAPCPDEVAERIAALPQPASADEWPKAAGRRIGIRRKTA